MRSGQAGNAAQRCFDKRLFPRKDRRTRQRPIDYLRRRPVRLQAFALAVRRLRKYYRLAVAPRYQNKPFTTRRRSVVARAEFFPFDCITVMFKGVHETTECFPLMRDIWLARGAVYTPPSFEFFDILENYNTGFHQCRPTNRNPRKTAYMLFHGLTAFCFGKVFAVGRKPH